MSETSDINAKEAVEMLDLDHVRRLAARSWTTQAAVRYIRELLGVSRGKVCLLVNGAEAGCAAGVLESDGDWYSLHTNPDLAASFKAERKDRHWPLTGSKLPFDDQWFDVVVINDILEHSPDPARLLADGHRVLKQDGLLILNAPRTKQWAVAHTLRRWMGLDERVNQPPPRSFTESELFDVAKDGFDFEESRTYGRFFSEFTEGIIGFAERLSASRAAGDADERLVRVRNRFYPLAVVMGWFDHLVGFTGGYHMVIRARRRVWRPRRTPRLVDGRSIADAAINTKIGTAGPF